MSTKAPGPSATRPVSRRGFLRLAGISALLPCLPGVAQRPAAAPAVEPSPDLGDGRVLRSVAGLRPYREGGVRVEVVPGRYGLVVHNYGHGGAGFTLSWGCAMEVETLLREHVRPPAEVAVLGAGVIGLTTAMTLHHAGYGVAVYARDLPPDTTSDLAGAQWSPTLVERGAGADARTRWRRMLVNSLRRFRGLAGDEWGVGERRNYVETGRRAFAMVPPGVLPPAQPLDRLPFDGVQCGGRVQRTLLIEPPVFLPRLVEELRRRGVAMHRRVFESVEETRDLGPWVAVDCLGLGAREVWGDRRLVPIRGQLVHVEPQDLPWLLSHRRGYVFPRRDAVVLGGTAERGVEEATTSRAASRAILTRARRFFGQ